MRREKCVKLSLHCVIKPPPLYESNLRGRDRRWRLYRAADCVHLRKRNDHAAERSFQTFEEWLAVIQLEVRAILPNPSPLKWEDPR